MSFVSASISGGFLEATEADTRKDHTMFTVSETPDAMTDVYIHLTREQAAQWAAVLTKFAGVDNE